MDIENIKRWSVICGLLFFLLWESAWPFFHFFRKKFKQRSWHVVMNIIIGQINALMIALIFIGAWWWAAGVAAERGWGILNVISLGEWQHALGAILFMDFWTYWWHRINHEVPFFWRFHQVHHSDREMDVTTASRFHIGEIFFSSVIRIGLILLFGITLWELLLYEIFLNIVVQFHHANIGLPTWLDKFLRIFIVTPAMHKVHHSDWHVETDSNYTSLFSWWDRVFGTFRLRDDPREIQFGLKQVDEEKSRDFVGVNGLPFKREEKGEGSGE